MENKNFLEIIKKMNSNETTPLVAQNLLKVFKVIKMSNLVLLKTYLKILKMEVSSKMFFLTLMK